MTAPPRVRCAIYTRKSSEEGLDQEFNSLDAQWEACAAYVSSQIHEGWRLRPDRYDDGGWSGGNMERPALARLLTDIEAGQIDLVVVYKIDRLTRSLTDFARLVERLDSASCSFVSVTQAFNTSTSMGRLTLNVLLSFAQFEREVTAERIRDKIAASKKKGMWMGGLAPLGFDAVGEVGARRLKINPTEADAVRLVFALYDDHACLNRVAKEAEAAGVRSKARQSSNGKPRGSAPLSRGQIHFLLTNPIYIGLVRHKERTWPGQHAPIVSQELWDRVQTKLIARSGRTRGTSNRAHCESWLAGKLVDETGGNLLVTHTRGKSGKRYRYYVSAPTSRDARVSNSPSGAWRLPASRLETAVADLLAQHLLDRAQSHGLLVGDDIEISRAVGERARRCATMLRDGGYSALASIKRVALQRGKIGVGLDSGSLAGILDCASGQIDERTLNFAAPLMMRRRGVEARIVVGATRAEPDPVLVSSLATAHRWLAKLREGHSLSALAKEAGCTPSFIANRTKLAFLSPRIQQAILSGEQRPDVTLERIIRAGVPLSWDEQARRFGFKA